MRKTIYGIMVVTVLALGLTGCGGSGGGGSEGETFNAGTIKYNDGSTMGVTKEEASVNGIFNIYDISSGEVIGSIGVNGSVNDLSGNDIGVCVGATITDNGVLGECNVPTANPSGVTPTKPTTPTPTTPTTPTPPPPPPTPNVTISVNVTHENRIVYDGDTVSWFSNSTVKNTSSKPTYQWTLTSKPAGSTTTFSGENKQQNPGLFLDKIGTYKVKLVATVNGVTATDTGSITAKDFSTCCQ